MALAAILAFVAHSAPCPHILGKRQLEMLGELASDITPEAFAPVADDTQLNANTLDSAEAQAPSDTINNLAGNTLTQIDNSTSSSLTNIEYPDETQMTGNTGTAVSGNNNDIMPIINAPVTVIINSSEDSHRRHHAGSKPPPVAMPAANAGPAWQPSLAQPSNAVPGGSFFQQPVSPLPPYPEQANVDPFGERIQQLIAYALSVSQGHI
ncbi:hypothetical protein GGI21_000966 [Coemansia aciculifera]|nr:hypothetical protein GGI21_000966 [Coemansia aciculifera]